MSIRPLAPLLLGAALLAACTSPDRTCAPDCSSASCGDDGCGGSCGTCAASATCVSGACVDVAQLCSNSRLDSGESDVDCGGPCAACADGKSCAAAADCSSKECTKGRCTQCANSRRDGTETDVDCGGSCAPCGAGRACGSGADCASANCAGGHCGAPATCEDNQKSPGETDVDCGGPDCRPCAVTKFCAENRDCLSLTCIFGVCERPSCTDHILNQDEVDVDCGGVCSACADGATCGAARDCASGKCVGNRCVSCANHVKDGDETDVDCGGTCGDCADGKTCGGNGDCKSGRCTAGRCTSCTDHAKNGDETDVDCGGSCADCADGKTCLAPADCTGKGCEGGLCCTTNRCGKCGALPKETCNGQDDDCDGQVDETSDIGPAPACEKQQGVCAGAWKKCAGTGGWTCGDDVYLLHSSAYEPVETTCDGKDNDCDGQVDEGLLNACGRCGAPPPELCNGKDDDCDGQVDETPECQACSATAAETIIESDSTVSSTGAWANGALAVDGTTAYLLTGGGYQSPSHVRRIASGQPLSTVGPELPNGGSIVFANGELQVGATAAPDFSTYEPRYYHFAPTATSASPTTMAPNGWPRGPGYEVLLAANGAFTAATFATYDNYSYAWNTWVTRYVNGAWTDLTQLANSQERAWVAVTPQGEVWAAYGQHTRKLGAAEQGLTNEYPLRLRVDPDGTPVLLVGTYSNALGLQRRTSSGWGAFESIAGDSAGADIAWGPDGTAYVARVPPTTGARSVRILRRGASGTWTEVGSWSPSSGADAFEGVELAVDAVGRLHLAYASSRYDATRGVNVHSLRYALVCP